MKLAILYTSYRQFRELDFAPAFFERALRLREEADILFHCNNGTIDQAALREKLAKIPAKSLTVRFEPQQNTGGYPYGQFEAIRDLWNHVDLSQWDWIIHIHPDLFIADEKPLLAAIEKAEAGGKEMLVTKCFGHRSPTFATDFFAFKPLSKIRPVFDSYLPLLATPLVVPLEALFFIEVHRAGVAYDIALRFLHGHYHKDIDQLGVWHEHQLDRLPAYLRDPSGRWNITRKQAFLHPKLAARTFAEWIGRRLHKIPQEPLSKQLTRIEPADD
jgi:hypothetical protein